jgi:hypothetical protein
VVLSRESIWNWMGELVDRQGADGGDTPSQWLGKAGNSRWSVTGGGGRG